MSFMRFHKNAYVKFISMVIAALMFVDQVHAGNQTITMNNTIYKTSNLGDDSLLVTSWKSSAYKREVSPAEVIWDADPHVQFTFVNIVVQVAVMVATRIMKMVMKIQQKKMISELIKRISNTSRGLSESALSGTLAARVAKLMETPDIDYEAYLFASKEEAKARLLTEQNLKSAAEVKYQVEKEVDETAERFARYTQKRMGTDYEKKTIVLEDVADKFDAYVKDLSKTYNAFNDLNSFLEASEKQGVQQASAFSNMNFLSNEELSAADLSRVSKAEFSANAAAIKADAEAQKKAAEATQALTDAGNAYLKYLDDNKLSEHPKGDAKADELYKQMQTLSMGLSEPYGKIEQTTAAVYNSLTVAIAD